MKIVTLDVPETASTNNYAAALINDSCAEEGMVILSFRQTEGRGQAGNKWESANSQNLTFSLILKPDFLPASQQFLISQVVALGIVQILRTITNAVSIKWPNDIMIDNRKVAGILIENIVKGNQLNWSICGVGVNINQCEFQKYSPEAVSLRMETEVCYDLELLLSEITESIALWYNSLKAGEIEFVREAYLGQLFRLERWTWFDTGTRTFEARIHGVDEFGQLILEERNKQKNVWPYKSVRMIF